MTKTVLAIHYGHDSNVTLIDNGQVAYAISEERFSRVKFDNSFPSKSIDYILDRCQLDISTIDAIVLIGSTHQHETGGGSLKVFYKKIGIPIPIWAKLLDVPFNVFDNLFPNTGIKRQIYKNVLLRKLADLGIQKDKIKFIDHHFAHAAGAFYLSGFDRAVVVTADGKGDGLSNATYAFEKSIRGATSEQLFSTKDYDSIGFFYSTITEFLGFKRLRHEGKVTGLSAFGKLTASQVEQRPVGIAPCGFRLKNMLIDNTARIFFPSLANKILLA